MEKDVSGFDKITDAQLISELDKITPFVPTSELDPLPQANLEKSDYKLNFEKLPILRIAYCPADPNKDLDSPKRIHMRLINSDPKLVYQKDCIKEYYDLSKYPYPYLQYLALRVYFNKENSKDQEVYFIEHAKDFLINNLQVPENHICRELTRFCKTQDILNGMVISRNLDDRYKDSKQQRAAKSRRKKEDITPIISPTLQENNKVQEQNDRVQEQNDRVQEQNDRVQEQNDRVQEHNNTESISDSLTDPNDIADSSVDNPVLNDTESNKLIPELDNVQYDIPILQQIDHLKKCQEFSHIINTILLSRPIINVKNTVLEAYFDPECFEIRFNIIK